MEELCIWKQVYLFLWKFWVQRETSDVSIWGSVTICMELNTVLSIGWITNNDHVIGLSLSKQGLFPFINRFFMVISTFSRVYPCVTFQNMFKAHWKWGFTFFTQNRFCECQTVFIWRTESIQCMKRTTLKIHNDFNNDLLCNLLWPI